MKKYLLIAVIVLIAIVIFFQREDGGISAPSAIKPYIPAIQAELEKEAKGRLCIEPPSGFFPYHEEY